MIIIKGGFPESLITMKEKSQKQVRYLLSKGSPLKSSQKQKLQKELHKGTVKIKK